MKSALRLPGQKPAPKVERMPEHSPVPSGTTYFPRRRYKPYLQNLPGLIGFFLSGIPMTGNLEILLLPILPGKY